MKRTVSVLVVVALLLSYGIAEGLWTNRWSGSEDLSKAVARLGEIPRSVGQWQGVDQELDARQVARAEMAGYLMRRYVHGLNGASVTVLLVCGRAGPTSLHSPDVCYAGAGYTQAAAPTRQEIEVKEPTATFLMGKFRKPGPAPEPLNIHWSWTGTGDWEVPDHPRLQFAHHPVLYKLYVIRSLSGPDESVNDDPAQQFLREFLPVVHKFLFAPAGG